MNMNLPVCVIVYTFLGLQSMQCALDSSIAEKIVASPPAVCVGCPWVEWHFKRTISEGEGRETTSKREEPLMSIVGSDSGEEKKRRGGREGKERERVWEGPRLKQEGRRERAKERKGGGGEERPDPYLIMHCSESPIGGRGGWVCAIRQAFRGRLRRRLGWGGNVFQNECFIQQECPWPNGNALLYFSLLKYGSRHLVP